MPLPNMTFIQDVTIGEGESVPPDTNFTKTWRVQNSGKLQIYLYYKQEKELWHFMID